MPCIIRASVMLPGPFQPEPAMTCLYPDLEPYAAHVLKHEGQQLYVEESGNPDGFPVLFLHGGPGSSCKPYHRSLFDPRRYRIILADQRGAGRSQPQGDLSTNNTPALLRDMEFIRQWLGVARWLLFGGSWGATLALLYAQAHRDRVCGLILRGVFLARAEDLTWFVGESGVRRIYPEAWEQLQATLSAWEQDDPLPALNRHLTGADELAQRRAARAWDRWGAQVALGEACDPRAVDEHVPWAAVNQARIELHYAVNRYFIRENAILDAADRLAGLPCAIVHGRRDLVCPVEAAWRLHQAMPGSTLTILPEAGHIAAGESMLGALVEATDAMASRLEVGR